MSDEIIKGVNFEVLALAILCLGIGVIATLLFVQGQNDPELESRLQALEQRQDDLNDFCGNYDPITGLRECFPLKQVVTVNNQTLGLHNQVLVKNSNDINAIVNQVELITNYLTQQQRSGS